MGCGGIATADDVLEFLVAGCAAVQVGTASFGDPGLLGRLAGEVSAKLDAARIATAAELVGTLRLPGAAEAPGTKVAAAPPSPPRSRPAARRPERGRRGGACVSRT
jgi:hypothetical protein